MSLSLQVSWCRAGRLPGRKCLAGRLPVAAYYVGLARPVRGLYGARALICRPLRGKVSLQWPSIKGPDVDLAARSLPGRRCLAGRLPVAACYMGPATPVRGLYGARAFICRPLRGKVSLQWPSSKGPDMDLWAPAGQSELAMAL